VHTEARAWVARCVGELHPSGAVLEVGSRDVNGGVRDMFGRCSYTGLDLAPGCDVEVIGDGRTQLTAKDSVLSANRDPWPAVEQSEYWLRCDELVGGLDRGLLVTRFHYTNPVHPKLAIVTGMTRDGTFLVEDGKIVGPVRNLRFTQSYLAALAGTVAVGQERKTLKGDFGGVLVPSVRIEGWTFTGATEH